MGRNNMIWPLLGLHCMYLYVLCLFPKHVKHMGFLPVSYESVECRLAPKLFSSLLSQFAFPLSQIDSQLPKIAKSIVIILFLKVSS